MCSSLVSAYGLKKEVYSHALVFADGFKNEVYSCRKSTVPKNR